MTRRRPIPSETDVVIIGAGISGVMAARTLKLSGVDRVVLLEARDRIGGRLKRGEWSDGQFFEAGGELIGPTMPIVNRLGDEFGLERVDLPFEGKAVRITGGERFVEAYPFELSPDLGAAYTAASDKLDELSLQIPIDAPWDAPGAVEFDAMTVQTWIDQNVEDQTAADLLAAGFMYLGGAASELSLLYVLWFLRSFGGSEGMHVGTSQRFKDGSSELLARLVAELDEDQILLEAPVRTVRQEDGGVTVVSDRGEVRAKAVVAAVAPQLCARIVWEPELPSIRDRLQSRYLQGHGMKILARYDTAWWRAEGLAGVGVGLPQLITMDVTAPDARDATLLSFLDPAAFYDGPLADAVTDDAAALEMFQDAVGAYFGKAPEPKEFRRFAWQGDPWAFGCGAGLPPGVLTTVGRARNEPVGRIVWAGAETGSPCIDWIEGALSAGERAAGEAAQLAGGR